MALSAVFGLKYSVPARLLIDHGPLIEASEDQDWVRLVVASLQPVAVETDWQSFLQECAGSETTPPLGMTSDEGLSGKIRAMWNDGKNWRRSRDAWLKGFHRAVALVKTFERMDVTLAPFKRSAMPYSHYLVEQLAAVRIPAPLRKKFDSVNTRMDALDVLGELDRKLGAIHRRLLTHAVVAAKSDENSARIDTAQITPSVSTIVHSFRGQRHGRPPGQREFSFRAPILNARWHAADLLALNGDDALRERRNMFVNALSTPGTGSVDDCIISLSDRAEYIIRRRRRATVDTLLARVIVPISAALKAAQIISPEVAYVLLIPSMLLPLAALPEGSRAWKWLHCDRTLKRQLVQAGTAIVSVRRS